jgi:hypothetical protein
VASVDSFCDLQCLYRKKSPDSRAASVKYIVQAAAQTVQKRRQGTKFAIPTVDRLYKQTLAVGRAMSFNRRLALFCTRRLCDEPPTNFSVAATARFSVCCVGPHAARSCRRILSDILHGRPEYSFITVAYNSVSCLNGPARAASVCSRSRAEIARRWVHDATLT